MRACCRRCFHQQRVNLLAEQRRVLRQVSPLHVGQRPAPRQVCHNATALPLNAKLLRCTANMATMLQGVWRALHTSSVHQKLRHAGHEADDCTQSEQWLLLPSFVREQACQALLELRRLQFWQG